MRKILSIVLCLFMLGTSFCLTACFGKNFETLPRNVEFNLPEKVHVVYSNGKEFAKDGNYVYGAGCVNARFEILMKENLNTPAVEQGNNSQYYISAHLSGDTWIMADTNPDSTYFENDNNSLAIYGYVDRRHGPEYYLRTGYSDVNGVILESSSLTQLENEVLTIGAVQVECVVWENVFEYDDTYSKCKYWYAVDTGICIKYNEAFDENDDIDADENNELIATCYTLNETINDILTQKGRPTIPARFNDYN